MELTENQILKIYLDYENAEFILCRTKMDAFIRGVQYALRHIKGGEWSDEELS